jgi:hypothetical protein
MARKKTEAPEPQAESLGATLPAVAAQEGEYMAAKQGAIDRIESMFQFPSVYDRDETVAALRNSVTQAALLQAYAGALLLRVKAHESHGEFLRIAQETVGKSPRTIQRMMLAARAMLDEDGRPRPILLAISGTNGEVKKLHELMSLSEEQLDDLDDGGMVGDLSLDTAPVLSPSELREALAAKEMLVDQKDEQIAKLQADLDKQDRTIGKLKRGGREVIDDSYAEQLHIATAAGTELAASVADLATRFADVIEDLSALDVPAHQEDVGKATAARAIYQAAMTAKQCLLASTQQMEAAFGMYLNNVPTDE